MNIKLYTKPLCSLCEQTKSYLRTKAIPYEEIQIERDISRDEILENFPGAKMLPLVVVDGTWIGGRDDIIKLVNSTQIETTKTIIGDVT